MEQDLIKLVSELKSTKVKDGVSAAVGYLLKISAGYFDASKAVVIEGGNCCSWEPASGACEEKEIIPYPLLESGLWADVTGTVKMISVENGRSLEEEEQSLRFFLEQNRIFTVLGITYLDGDGDRVYLIFYDVKKHRGDIEALLFFSLFTKLCFENFSLGEKEEKLRISEERFCIALKQIGANVWEYDIPSKTLHQTEVSQGLNDLPSTVSGIPESLIEIGYIHPDSAEEFRRLVKSVEEGIQNAEGTYKVKRKKGIYRWQKTRCKIIYDESNLPIKAVAMGEDITDMMEQKERYHHELSYRDAISQELIASYQVNLTKDEVENCRSRENGEWENSYQTYEQLMREEGAKTTGEEERRKIMDALAYGRLLKQFTEGESTVSHEYQRISSEGRVIWVRITVNMVKEPEHGDIIAFVYIRDIDRRKKRELTLAERAKRDKITGFYNKSTVEGMIRDMLGKCAGENIRCALILINLDNFKNVNAAFGQKYGDKTLADLSQIIRSCFKLDSVLGRIGGDEFVVFMPDIISEDEVTVSVRALCRNINMTYKAGEDTIHISGSVGITIGEAAATDYDTLFRQAETALYVTKQNGKNGYCVYSRELETEENGKASCGFDDAGGKGRMLDEFDFSILVLAHSDRRILYRNEYMKNNCSSQSSKLLESYCLNIIEEQSALDELKRQEDGLKADRPYNIRLSDKYVIRFKPILWNSLHAYLFLVYNTDTEPLYHFTSEEEEDLYSLFCRLAKKREVPEVQKDILSYLGRYYNAARTLLLEQRVMDTSFKRIFEWHEEDLEDCLEILKNIEFEKVPEWEGEVRMSMPMSVTCLEQISDSRPAAYKLMKSRGIRSFCCLPAWYSKNSILYLCVLNPKRRVEDIRPMTLLLPFQMKAMQDYDLNKRLTDMIYKDSLTGVLNRSSYLEYESEFGTDTVSTLGVASVDINGLKKYNIRYGSSYGDHMIASTADLLKKTFVSSKIFRMAADEFLIVEEDVSYERFTKEVEFFKQNLSQVDQNLASVGCVWEKQNINLEDQVRQADELMRIEKQNYYHSSGDNAFKKEENMEKRLREELEAGRFQIYLQPKARVSDRKVVAAEALVRYIHPEKGMVAPGKFIPQLEQAGMIQYLDFYVFEQVCSLIRDWKHRGLKPIKISTNFSRATVLQGNLVPYLLDLCSSYEVSPEEIEIEVTETLGTMSQETLAAISRNLRKAGFSISLDDFGSRFSSMSILSTMDFDVLKLDKSMIDNIYNYKAEVMVEATLNFCRKAGIVSIAEGVETEEQLAILKRLGCDAIQGYLLNKPLPVDVFERCYAESLR
ncbi:MAG: EAL domain-containing protein [Clostridiaceae bacterium]|nr:EAL domain-containing protein [Clostridiaceae bacterium]